MSMRPPALGVGRRVMPLRARVTAGTLAFAFARAGFRQWWQARLPLSDTLTLTQRNVYILPTRAGFMLGATLLVLLVGSINYQLNLGYLLTFLLAGSAVVGMHVCHATLRGLTLTCCRRRRIRRRRGAAVGRARPARARRATASAWPCSTRRTTTLDLDRRAGAGAGARCRSASSRRARGLHRVPPLHRRNALSARHLPRLDGVAAGSAGAGLSRARTAIRRRCPPGEPRAGARGHGARAATAASSTACAPTAAATR